MQASPLLRAHRRVLIAKRLHDQALKSLVPGLESSYRRLSKADQVLAIAKEQYLQLARQGLDERRRSPD